jgi:hypothetical protein
LPEAVELAVFFAVGAAELSATTPNVVRAVTRHSSRAILKSQPWVTGKPLNLRVLQEVSAL